MFHTLLRYRVKLETALSFACGTLAASGMYYYALINVANLNQAIEPHLCIVDDILAELISPTDASITVDELARHHGYPPGDLSEIDLDWV